MKHWYTNNIDEHTFEEGMQPDGYKRGRLQSTIEKQLKTELSKPKEQRKSEYQKRSNTNRSAHHKRTEEARRKMSIAGKGKIPWNKGLTKETDDRLQSVSEISRKAMLNHVSKKRIEDPNYYTEWRKSIRKKMHQNKTTKSSNPEDTMYKNLCEIYGEDDVIRHYFDADRYPFECDFYIKSEDHFIELNLHPSHGDHPFDETNEKDIQLVERLSCENSDWSKMILNVWTKRDKNKMLCAKNNNLFYTVIYHNYSFSLQ